MKLLGDHNEKEIKKMGSKVENINSMESHIQVLSDEELRGKTTEFKERLAKGETLDELLPEAFAVVREASKRVLGMRHFDVQLMGGIVLHENKIAEMKTGEGKTLVATLPAYLNALTGKGVHIVTVNDYLAKRDSEWMGQVYEFLGLSVGLIVHEATYEQRQTSYRADITYGTNNEFGFDYLRDNMVLDKNQLVQRKLNYAIVDEVDSILVDEARTPLIISGQGDTPTEIYYQFAQVVTRLKPEVDYQIDEKMKAVAPTEEGIHKVEQLVGVDNLYDDVNMELSHHLNQALKAKALMKRDKDYVVKDGEVIIVDEFTGRLMVGRRYSEGLHQAIEAKEGVKIKRESQTLASITFQNYFRMYDKLAGMTGTAKTEEQEFQQIYGLDVVVMPTNKPMVREDSPDVIYKTEKAKFRAVVREVEERHAKNQPVLVGTVSIDKSEELSHMLKRKGIPHTVLNAKYHEKEAEIVAGAGQIGAVTIATNMAGRGTDIVLGDGVADLGGFSIIGTERHESRRIDNQLRGRSGRQGDPGCSRFYVSLEDDLMRLFGSDNVAAIMGKMGMDEDDPIEHKLISRSIENAQKKVEGRNFDIRKQVLEYDNVMNKQREVIYNQRRQILEEEGLKEQIQGMIEHIIDTGLNIYANEEIYPEDWDLAELVEYCEQNLMPHSNLKIEVLQDENRESLKTLLLQEAEKAYEAKEAEIGSEQMRELERIVMLKTVDSKWMNHLDIMDSLRQGIGLQAIGQKNPLLEYQREAYDIFQGMIQSIQQDIVRYIYRVQIVSPEERARKTSKERKPQMPFKNTHKIGRNDPCPCGSGKKYKKCCGR